MDNSRPGSLAHALRWPDSMTLHVHFAWWYTSYGARLYLAYYAGKRSAQNRRSTLRRGYLQDDTTIL